MAIDPKCEKCERKCKQDLGGKVIYCPKYKPKEGAKK